MSAPRLLLEHNRNWTSSMTENVDELPWKPEGKWVRRGCSGQKLVRLSHNGATKLLQGTASSARPVATDVFLGSCV